MNGARSPSCGLLTWISTIKLVEKYILKQIDYMKWNLRKEQRWSKSVWTFVRYRPHSLTFRVIISFIKKTIILKKHHKKRNLPPTPVKAPTKPGSKFSRQILTVRGLICLRTLYVRLRWSTDQDQAIFGKRCDRQQCGNTFVSFFVVFWPSGPLSETFKNLQR